MNIFLDDCRETPKGFYRTFTVEETIKMLKDCYRNNVVVNILSLDNDLGEGQKEGRRVLDFLEEEVFLNNFPLPQEIRIHSSNSAARYYMVLVLEKLRKTIGCNYILV